MEKLCGIYKITSPSKKIYIGQSNNIKNRFRFYRKLQCKRQLHLYNSFLKYGIDKHKFEILHLCNIEDLNTLEKYYVDLYQTFNTKYGMNLRDGGGNRTVFSDETRLKMSLAKKGKPGKKGWIPSKELREQWSKTRKGMKPSKESIEKRKITMKGRKLNLSPETLKKKSLQMIEINKKHYEKYLLTGEGYQKKGVYHRSEELKKKQGDMLRGISRSNEIREKIRQTHIGVKFSKERCENISKSLKGRTFTEEAKQHMSEAGKKRVFTKEHRDKINEAKRKKKLLNNN